MMTQFPGAKPRFKLKFLKSALFLLIVLFHTEKSFVYHLLIVHPSTQFFGFKCILNISNGKSEAGMATHSSILACRIP